MQVVCDNCKKEFNQHTHWAKLNKHNFCCRVCYYEWRKDYHNNHNWKGGKAHMLGYEFTFVKDHPHANSVGYVKTSRLVMEEYLGRYLNPKEVVHHIDGDVTNNNIENPMLFANKSEHQKHHWKIRKLVKELQPDLI